MVAKSPSLIWRGYPESDDHLPEPAWIVELLEEIQLQVSLGGAPFFVRTLTDLEAITPAETPVSGIVLHDPDLTLCGIYLFDGSTWSKTSELPAGFDVPTVEEDIAALGVSVTEVEDAIGDVETDILEIGGELVKVEETVAELAVDPWDEGLLDGPSTPAGRGVGFDAKGDAHFGDQVVYPYPDGDWDAPLFHSLVEDSVGKSPLGLGADGELLAISVTYAPVDLTSPWESPLLYPAMFSGRAVLLGITRDGELDFIPSKDTIARINAALPADKFRGLTVFNIRYLGDQHMVATYQTPDGYVGDLMQRRTGESTAVPFTASAFDLLQGLGQSNERSGSGPTGTPPINGVLKAGYLLMPDDGGYVGGSAERAEGDASDFAAIENPRPSFSDQAQTPTDMTALGLYNARRHFGYPQNGIVVTNSAQGSTPLGNFVEGDPLRLIETAIVQAADSNRIAETYGQTLRHIVKMNQGEAGPHANSGDDWRDLFYDFVDVEVPKMRTAAGADTSEVFFVQTSSTEDAGQEGSALGQLAAARARLGARVTMFGAVYDGPLHDNAHRDNEGRIMIGEREGLISHYVLDKGVEWHPPWPTSGGVTRSGAVITIPIELPEGTTALSRDTDWVPATANDGFSYTNDSVSPPAISSVTFTSEAIVVTLATDPGEATGGLISYAMDAGTAAADWSLARGNFYVDSGVPSTANANGVVDIPNTIRFPLSCFEEPVL